MAYADPDARRAADRAYYLANRSKRLATVKARYDRIRQNPDARGALAAYKREWRRRKRQDPAYRARELAADRTRPWEKVRAAVKAAGQKAARYGLPKGDITRETMARIHLLPCAYCGALPAHGADHVIPMSKGGPNTVANLVPACLSCNRAKRDTLVAA